MIIPVYNARSYLGFAIESARTQQGVSVEVIVVDDGSTDGSWEMLEQFGESIHRVRQTNAGPGKARNLGAQLANANWLAFLDADDEWAPDKLARQLALAGTDAGLIYTDRMNIGESSRVAARQSDSVSLHEGDVFADLILNNFITLSSAIMRKADFVRLGGFDERAELRGVEDWDLWLRYAAEGPVCLCPEPLTRYRWHADGISRRLGEMYRGHLAVLERAFASPRGRRLSSEVRSRARANALRVMAWYATEADPRKALLWYTESLRFRFWDCAVHKAIVKLLFGPVFRRRKPCGV